MELRKLHGDFGVEVLGFPIKAGGSEAEIAALRRAYDDHAMLLFRGAGPLAHERHVEIARWFGPPSPVDNGGDGQFVTVLQNAEAAGSVALPFHSDLTYTDDPIAAICLQAIDLPDAPTSTTFVSGAAAWEHLPESLRRDVEGLTLRHVLDSSVTGYDWPTFIADHPLKFVHPRTGRPILFATEHHATRLLDVDEARSRELIAALFTHLYAPERQYEHVWQLGDLLMWDNLVLQHARTQASQPAGGRRALQRVALSDTPLDVHVDRARQREREQA